MKIKNILQIAALAGLTVSESAYSMQAIRTAVVNSAKATMRWTGNAIGVGLPLSDTPVSLWSIQKIKSTNEKTDTLRDPSELEKQFLDQHITSKRKIVKIQRNTDAIDRAYCETDGQYIVLPETYSNLTLENALAANDTAILSQCTAIAQHKNKHAEKHHTQKLFTLKVTAPVITTGLASGMIYKLFPYNKSASLTRHFLSMGKKIAGGNALLFGNTALIRKTRHNHEYDADQAVAQEHRETYAKDLQAMEDRFNGDIQAIQQVMHIQKLLGSQPSFETALALSQLSVNRYLMLPPLQKRVKLLAQDESKLSFLERIKRDLNK